MKISLITSTYNSESTLEDTIKSVASQTYDSLEYIIVDGGSTDGTMAIVDRYSNLVAKHISEKDQGIYDALNKGIALATGEVIGFLHSDDLFADQMALERVATAFQDDGVDAVYGDLDYVDREKPSKVVRAWRSCGYDDTLFQKGWMPAHPTFYLRTKHYREFGDYDIEFKQSADYELMLRMLKKKGLQAEYIPHVLVKMRLGGASNVSLKNRLNANKEDALAWKKNGLNPGALFRLKKPLSKIGQFFGS